MATSRQPPAASAAAAFDQSHQGRMRSAVVEQIYRTAFGQDYPAGAHPSAFYSATTLRLAISALQLSPGSVVADLGCGHGGPGLWAARQTGATLTGIDLYPAFVDLARRGQAAQLGLDRQAASRWATWPPLGCPTWSCDAVISLDVLMFVPDKAAAAREIARILAPGRPDSLHHLGTALRTQPTMTRSAARLPARSTTTPCCNRPEPTTASSSRTQALPIETYREPPGWRRQQQALAKGIIAAEAELTEDMGRHYTAMARVFLADLPGLRYILVTARRPAHAPADGAPTYL